jgi:hypothetical protein
MVGAPGRLAQNNRLRLPVFLCKDRAGRVGYFFNAE